MNMNDKAGLGTVSVENAVRSSLNNNNLVDSGIGSPESGGNAASAAPLGDVNVSCSVSLSCL